MKVRMKRGNHQRRSQLGCLLVHQTGSQTRNPDRTEQKSPNKCSRRQLIFCPIDWDWQTDRAASVNWSDKLSGARHPEKCPQTVSMTAKPRATVHVRGDGNCLFRALSYTLLGHEGGHRDMRYLLCNFIQTNDSGFFQITNSKDYVAKAGMAKFGVWGTEVEIFAFATVFNTNVYVFSDISKERMPCWLRYAPLEGIKADLVETEKAVFLSNMHHHFEPVFSVEEM